MGQTFSHFADALQYGLLPLAVIAGVCTLTAWIIMWDRALAGMALVFALVGTAMGLTLGSSRESAVAAYLPALLTLVGALLVFTFPRDPKLRDLITGRKSGKDADDPTYDRKFVMVGIVALIVSSVVATSYGASFRSLWEQEQREYAKWLKHYEMVELPLSFLQMKAALGIVVPESPSVGTPAP